MTSKTSKPSFGSQTGALAVLGFALVVLGWGLLLAGLFVSDQTLRAGSLVAAMATRSDIVTVAQTAIGTGLGLAIIGALRSGFGAFSRFFEAVLHRSATPRPSGTAERPVPPVAVTPFERETRSERAPPAAPPPLRGKDRNYVVLPDGSVEVETMFGTRIFATLDEAREFIR